MGLPGGPGFVAAMAQQACLLAGVYWFCGGRPAARRRDLARRAGWRAGFGAVGRQINTLPLFGVRSR